MHSSKGSGLALLVSLHVVMTDIASVTLAVETLQSNAGHFMEHDVAGNLTPKMCICKEHLTPWRVLAFVVHCKRPVMPTLTGVDCRRAGQLELVKAGPCAGRSNCLLRIPRS
jgi:hypothetical protein